MTSVRSAPVLGRREGMAAIYNGFGGIACSMLSTFKIIAVKSDVNTVCEVADTSTIVEI